MKLPEHEQLRWLRQDTQPTPYFRELDVMTKRSTRSMHFRRLLISMGFFADACSELGLIELRPNQAHYILVIPT